MERLGNVVFNDREIENKRLELTDPKTNYILGPNLTLRNCTLVLKVSARHLSELGGRVPEGLPLHHPG